MSDLTIIYLTANRMPPRWVEFHRKHLLAAVGDYPLITVSMEPMDLGAGETKLIQTTPWGSWNTFCEWNRAAKVAQTEFVAIAEDDTLYHPLHYRAYRPKPDEVVYDMSRWTVMPWYPVPRFSLIRRMGGFSMICPRDLMIQALDEREARWPDGYQVPGEIGRARVERRMRVTVRKSIEWYCAESMVTLAHSRGLSSTFQDTPGMRRREGEVKAIEIPYWGRAEDIAAIYNDRDSA